MDIKYSKDTSKTNEDIEYKFGVWYPIESAPKDGIEILLFNGKHIFLGLWEAEFEEIYNKYTDSMEYRSSWTDNVVTSWEYQEVNEIIPTHWMPLPPKP